MRSSLLMLTILLLALIPLPAGAIGGGDIVFTPGGVDPVKFSHDHHSKERGLKCTVCHFQKFARGQGYEMKKEAITKREFCGHCHNGMKSFDQASAKNCVRCHKK